MNIRGKKKKIKVLLAASPKTDLGFDRAVRIPNLGLSSIAANLDRTFCEVNVLDLVVSGNPVKHFQRVLASYRPDVVGFSCMSFQYADMLNFARITKSFCKDIIVIMGGYHPTVAYDEILINEDHMQYIDFLMRNEGEIAFNSFIKALYTDDDLKNVPNLSFIDNHTIVNNPGQGILDLAGIKPPDRKSRLMRKGFYLFGNRADVIETSRGCTSDCDFCSMKIMYGKSYRKYPVERVLNDIRDAKDHGARAIFAADDNINLDGRRYKELCEAIIDAGLHMKFFIQASIRGLGRTPGLINTMVTAGVKWIFLGIENVSENNLTFLDKNNQFRNEEVFDVVNELRKKNVVVIGGFIIGNPDDTVESIRANYEFAKKLRLDVALFFIVTPFPRTEIRKKLLEQGFVTNPDDYTRYTCFEANVKTKHLSSEQLWELREEMGYRYPIDSGSYWRLAREFAAHPIYYTIHLGFGQFIKDPMEVFRYLKGLSKRF